MYPFKRILVPTDFSLCAEAAFQHAFFLARHYHAEVHVFHVAPGKEASGETHRSGHPTWPTPRSDRTEGAHAVPIHQAITYQSDPIAGILDYARLHEIDLIVMGAHGDRGTGHYLSMGTARMFLGHTTEQVVRHATCPVFRVVMRSGREPDLVRRILVPMDLSALSLLGLAYAKDLAAFYNAPLDLLHVMERGAFHTLTEAAEVRAQADLVKLWEKTKGPDVTAQFHVAWGRPDRRIRAFAERQRSNLIVMGAHSDLGKDMLGIVAEEIVRTAGCPVFTVRNGEQSDQQATNSYRGTLPLTTFL